MWPFMDHREEEEVFGGEVAGARVGGGGSMASLSGHVSTPNHLLATNPATKARSRTLTASNLSSS